MSFKTTRMSQDLKAPVSLTVDLVQEKVYWMDNGINSKAIPPSVYSITFNGTNVEVNKLTLTCY